MTETRKNPSKRYSERRLDIKGKNENKPIKAVLSCDAFTTGYIVACLLFYVSHILNVGRNGGMYILWLMPIACLLPFAVLPLFYLAVHRFDMLLFGRYHLAMPISAYVAALFFVFIWSDGSYGVLSFFGALVFVSALLIYRYCAFSVRARLIGERLLSSNIYSRVFSALGAVGAVGTFAGFMYYDAATAYINTAYVLASACAVLATAHYLTTYYGIPRLGGKRVLSVKSVFGSFFGGLDKRVYFSVLLFEAAFGSIASAVVIFCFVRGVGAYVAIAVAAALIASYVVASCVCAKTVKRTGKILTSVMALCYVAAGSALMVAATVEMTEALFISLVSVSAVLVGGAGACTTRTAKLGLMNIKPRITAGTVYILTELTAVAAAAISAVVAALVVTLLRVTSLTGFAYGFALAAVFAIIAFALGGKAESAGGEGIKISHELTTKELDRASGADREQTAADA